MSDHTYFSNLIWSIADLLRGPYRPPQYERVMLPIPVLRRFDCVLAPTKAKVVPEHERSKGGKVSGDALDIRLNKVDAVRHSTERTIALLKERCSTHIAAAVTGNLEVEESGA